jgi:uncharacterized protein (DUF1800 family)
MQGRINLRLGQLVAVLAMASLFACGGGGSGGGGGGANPAPQSPAAAPAPEAPAVESLSREEASRFLSQASFGPSLGTIDSLVERGLESWLLEQFELAPTLHLEAVLSAFPSYGRFTDDNGNPLPELLFLASDSFWGAAIEAPDQLRQRMAYALSQILVVSAESNIGRAPQMLAHYMDVLTRNALGNYRDLLQDVTYSPAMAVYLTYLRNEKSDPATGRVPDENYARELLQLFTLGLVELGADGNPVLAEDGSQVELFDNTDITGLAKVFTGLSFSGADFRTPLRRLPPDAYHSPLEAFDAFHSSEPKRFLDTVIAAGTGAEESIDQALDAIFAHPNLGPFIGRQLIQRFVTSAPTPAYVGRVAAAFDAGTYAMPSGDRVGSGRRGDLQASIAAVLLDPEARQEAPRERTTFGKLREPVLRFTHWARAFEVNSADASNELVLRNAGSAQLLGQHPYRSPSVFNFYRPGYIAPGTATGAAGLTAPELQITNATSIVGYPNVITLYALGRSPQVNSGLSRAFDAAYETEAGLASDTQRLLDHYDLLLTHGTLRTETRSRIAGIIEALEGESEETLQLRARVASILVMTSPEYVVLR